MDFTIVTPNLNHGRFLAECLESVKEQAGATFEHFIADGGSTDDSAAIAARYPHTRWIPGPDRGMSDGINKGFAQATGDFVMWLNADDRLKPGALRAVKEFAAAHPAADVLYGSFDFVAEDGSFIRRIKMPPWSRFIHVHHSCYVPSTAAFYRRATVTAAGHLLREDFRYVMDGELYARLDAAGLSFAPIPAVLADFRLHGDNASMRHLKASRDLDAILAAERQHIESRAIRRAYGFTPFEDPYLNGLSDGLLWLAAKSLKGFRKLWIPAPLPPPQDR
ncbi:MAG: glycosyltransferase [Akkermansiaceae bacterium]|nr:glycosyltransferase [Akkermansiaceae bacterium]